MQASGQKIEFGDLRKVLVQRPHNLRLEIEQSDGDVSVVVFDGKELTAFDQSNNVYAKTPLEGDVDAAIIHFVRDLQMRLPLAMLLLSGLPAELDRRVQSLDYVEETEILGVLCDHLAGRTGDVDFQVWVAQNGPAADTPRGPERTRTRSARHNSGRNFPTGTLTLRSLTLNLPSRLPQARVRFSFWRR